MVTGSMEGSVWGTDIYTDDSNLAAAAVHAGAINNDETNTVNIKILPGELNYQGSMRNGITSSSYSAWEGSYLFIGVPVTTTIIIPNLKTYRDKIGQTFSFMIMGNTEGSVWGTDIYTDDSNLAAAAVHAGVVDKGEVKMVNVHILPGQYSYQGSTQNGITSLDYDAWEGSYKFIGTKVSSETTLPNLKTYRDKVGQTFSFVIRGNTEGSVWGTDIYTDDSNPAVAAVHAGAIDKDEAKMINVQILPGQSSYEGTTRNGITSSSYGIWEGSYSFVINTSNLDMLPSDITTDQSKLIKYGRL
ncbi:unnamed protein product [Rotaria sp. Silwood1]